jgi:prevent-host-death family protein
MTMVEVYFVMRTMAAGKFKATCLAVMDEVQAKREPVLLTKNGKPVAKLVPVEVEEDPLAVYRFPGKVEILGDIVSPAMDLEEWDALK